MELLRIGNYLPSEFLADTNIKNTIIYDITNGITEGFVNKLKVVKRIMYGKASIGLLKNKLTMEHVLFN